MTEPTPSQARLTQYARLHHLMATICLLVAVFAVLVGSDDGAIISGGTALYNALAAIRLDILALGWRR